MKFVLENWDAIIGILGGLLGLAWTFVRSSEWWAARKDQKAWRVARALEEVARVAVVSTYNNVVRDLKDNLVAENRTKLNKDEIRQIQDYALSVLKQEATKLPGILAKILLGYSDDKPTV